MLTMKTRFESRSEMSV